MGPVDSEKTSGATQLYDCKGVRGSMCLLKSHDLSLKE